MSARSRLSRSSGGLRPWPCHTGALLLEVILALGLLVAAGSVVVGGLSTSAISARSLALEAHAANLAVTLSSRMAVGLVPVGSSDAQKFEDPFADFTWEASVDSRTLGLSTSESVGSESTRDASVKRVHIVIRHPETGVLRRLTHWLPVANVGGDLAGPSVQQDFGDRARLIRELFRDD